MNISKLNRCAGKLSVFTTLLLLNSFVAFLFFAVQAEHSPGDDIYFQILNPDSLKYTYKTRLARNFGATFKTTEEKVQLVIVEPSDACSSISNPSEVRGNIGLIERGRCTFLTKCIEAEQSEMKGVIVFDNDESSDDIYVDMVDDTTSRNCSIPAVFMLRRDGYMIKQQMMLLGLTQVPIIIPINMTMVPFEHQNTPPWVFY